MEYKPYYDQLVKALDQTRINEFSTEDLERELFYLECNPWEAKYFLDVKSQIKDPVENTPGMIVVYALGISNDKPKKRFPIKYGSLPDNDFDTTCRDKIKDYKVKTYGLEHVCLIGTKGTFKVAGAIKAVMRQIYPEVPFDYVNDITDTIQRWEKVITKQVMDEEGEDAVKLLTQKDILERIVAEDTKIKTFLESYPQANDEINNMIGQAVSRGVHAAGLCMSPDRPIYEVCPCEWSEDHQMYVTSPEMKAVEISGLIKYDYLGLSTLSVIRDTRRKLKRDRGIDFDKNKIDLFDQDVWRKFTLPAMTLEGIFQFKTPTFEKAMVRIKKPEAFNSPDSASVMVATIRPGPMGAGVDDMLMDVMNGKLHVKHALPQLEPILKESYGLLIYQEQIMGIMREIGQLNEGDIAKFIKAVSKKDPDIMASYKEKYMKGVKAQKIDESLATKIWEDILKFGGYGFNKAHSMSYGLNAYITQYLNHYYREDFISCSIPHLKDEEFRRFYPAWQDVIRPPNVNLSKAEENATHKGKVYLAFNEIKFVASQGKDIEKHAPYKNADDFALRSITDANLGLKPFKCVVLAGGADCLAPKDMDVMDFRKDLISKYVAIKNGVEPLTPEEKVEGVTIADKKGKMTKTLQKALDELQVINKMPKISMLLRQVGLLNTSSCDYHLYMIDRIPHIESVMRAPVKRFRELYECDDRDLVTIIGFVTEAPMIKKVKKQGKNQGRDMAFITVEQSGQTLKIGVGADVLERDRESDTYRNGVVANTKYSYPLIVTGSLSKKDGELMIWAERLSVPSLKDILATEKLKI
ncbi:hypothetical protein [Bdellovibrio sp. BCCA]|uniref:hypothetical protein n=1 Tax=Bdellovibrio sp. BCCA TaxID=3136281 RepID=UPI0030F2585F